MSAFGASLYGQREVLIAYPQKILQTQVLPSAISFILHKVSTCMTYYRQQLSQNHIIIIIIIIIIMEFIQRLYIAVLSSKSIRFTCPLDRWDSIFCPALDNQLLKNTVSLLATNSVIYSNFLDKQNKCDAETWGALKTMY